MRWWFSAGFVVEMKDMFGLLAIMLACIPYLSFFSLKVLWLKVSENA